MVDDRPPAMSRSRRPIASMLMLAVLSLAIGVLAGGGVAYYAWTRPAQFQSSATLLIDQEPAVFQSADEGLLDKLARLRLKYAGLVNTDLFDQPIAAEMHRPLYQVRAGLTATADINNLLLVITATMPTRQSASQLAQLAADHVVRFAQSEQFDLGIPTRDEVKFSVVSAATSPVQTEPSTHKVVIEGLVVFVVVTVAGVVGADLLRRRN